MAKVTAPALSIGAGGQIAKTQVYSTWRGIPYVRRYVVPANPKTALQQETRTVFGWCTATWKSAPALFTASWTAFAKGKPLTDRNAFIGKNVKALRAGTSMTGIVFSPGAGGGLAPSSLSSTGGSGTITLTSVNPAAPSGWSITSMVGFAIKSEDPHIVASSALHVLQDTSTHDTVDFTGLVAGAYITGAMLIWSKPGNGVAYSISINGTATVT